jgi:hypothetical protein
MPISLQQVRPLFSFLILALPCLASPRRLASRLFFISYYFSIFFLLLFFFVSSAQEKRWSGGGGPTFIYYSADRALTSSFRHPTSCFFLFFFLFLFPPYFVIILSFALLPYPQLRTSPLALAKVVVHLRARDGSFFDMVCSLSLSLSLSSARESQVFCSETNIKEKEKKKNNWRQGEVEGG